MLLSFGGAGLRARPRGVQAGTEARHHRFSGMRRACCSCWWTAIVLVCGCLALMGFGCLVLVGRASVPAQGASRRADFLQCWGPPPPILLNAAGLCGCHVFPASPP